MSATGNIIRLNIIKIAKWFMLIMPIVVLFYNENGLGMSEVFILQSVYSIAIVVLEIPSGYMADALGRKNTLVAGSILGFLGYVIYSFSFGFVGFLFAEIVLGLGQSLISGADSALLYDTLLDEKREKDYLKYEGRLISIGNFAEALAGIAGGFLASYALRYPYIAQAAVAFIAVPAAFTLVEPTSSKVKQKVNFSDIISIVKFSLVDNIQLRWNILYSSIVGAATLTMAWFVQPWMIRAEIPVEWFGVIWTVLNLSVGITAMFAYKIELYYGKFTTAATFTFTLALGYIASGFITGLWGLLFIFLFYLARGIATPILKDNINRITPSEMRATVLSVRNFVIRIIFAVIGPLYGWITDKLSLAHALVIAGIVFLLLASVSFVFFKRTGNLNE